MAKGSSAKGGSVLANVRKICLSLPDTQETWTWGKPHFRVANKIFCGCGDEGDEPVIGFKLEKEHADTAIQDPRFTRAPYVGHKGWVSMDVSGVRDWEKVRPLILESYRLIAPKKTLAKLGESPAASASRPRTPRAAAGTKRPARKPAPPRRRASRR
jgi:predicted DNA-binding protein (MmcQ/YjbR family)